MLRIHFTLIALVLCTAVAAEPRAIRDASFVSIGGIEQWVTIRGADDRDPVQVTTGAPIALMIDNVDAGYIH